MAANLDFSPSAGLESLDLRLDRVASISAANAAATPMSKAIPRTADAVMFCSAGAVAVSLEGQAISANPTDGAISLQAGWSPLIQLELDVDTTPQVFNGTAGPLIVTMLVFTRRRRLARQRGQV